ncbi:hypothetical protein [Labrys sp. ZIDIC5]|uniref:hypothetical protein n=1 Tax=Labrys sedimenti TaxID=3106036 RepID=UPI002ACABE36|nr:hypothetical protein [Labrys sp. ZIDIC5]MDZ5448911.1 hypothetical protein [Labrys sp. ZIDIC5]
MTEDEIQKAARLWLQGRNTVEIAAALDLDEPRICTNLRRIRSEAHLIAARAA